MKNQLFFLLLLFVGFTACDNSYQYDVYVKNTTDENIKVVFKSPNNTTGTEEQSTVLKAGELKRIISTSNIGPEESETNAIQHCNHAAEYIKAYKGEAISDLEWCNKNIRFELEDIGQWTYTIEYKPEHF